MLQLNKSKAFGILVLASIVLLAGFIRIIKLDQVPNGLYSDEASLGYNAYSILKTGKDEFGKEFPIYFRSFGTYQLPVYTYLSTIPIFFLGLNIFSTRILSAVAGTLTVIIIYLIFYQIKIFKYKYSPFAGAFLIAFSPWSIFFSRGAFETNLAFLIVSISVYFYLLSLNINKKYYFVIASFFLSVATFAYSSERLFAYFLLVYLFFDFIRRTTFVKVKRIIFTSLIVFLVIQLPHFYIAFTPAFKVRAEGLFYKDSIVDQAIKLSIVFPYNLGIVISTIREFLSQFFAYLSPKNLFFYPDSEIERSIPELSVFFPWLFFPYLIGLWVIWLKKKERQIQFVLILTALFACIPALTKDPFATTRALPLILPLIIIICLGFEKIYSSKYRPVLFITPVLAVFSIIQFWRSYFVFFPNERAQIWQYGYRQLAEEVGKKPDTLFVIDQSRLKPSYIELAFFLKLPPEKLQAAVNPEIRKNYYGNTSFDPGYKFENIEIRNINWQKDIYENKILVGDELAVSENQAKEHYLTKVFEIRSPVDEVIFEGYHTNPAQKCGSISNANQGCQIR